MLINRSKLPQQRLKHSKRSNNEQQWEAVDVRQSRCGNGKRVRKMRVDSGGAELIGRADQSDRCWALGLLRDGGTSYENE